MSSTGRPRRRRSNPFLAGLRTSLALVLTLSFLAWLGVRRLGLSGSSRVTAGLELFQKWSGTICHLLGIEANIQGPVPPTGSCVTPNHQSYLDILLLASIVPMVFVAKEEIASWPGIGYLARTADQIFIERSRTRRMLKSLQTVRERLTSGQRVCVFLEGTTSGGDRVQRFHSSLLQPAMEADAPIVPAAIRWSASDPGISVSEDIAYWKDHNFALHLWRLLGLRGIQAQVRFGRAEKCSGRDRVRLARDLQSEVQDMFEG